MKKLIVLGGGESGVGAAILGKEKGWEVFLSDKGTISEKYAKVLSENGIRWEEKTHSEAEILQADCIVKSPGIPDSVEIIQKAKQKNIEIISEIEFAYRYTNGKIIAITGSNGKTTTTSLVYHLLKEAEFNVGLVGNIGKSFAQMVAQNDKAYYVLEISSFQLDGIVHFRPDIAILLNITPDHLDRYEYKFENYIASKFRITQNQTQNDFFIYDADDPVIFQWLKNHAIKAKKIPFSMEKEVENGAYATNNSIKIQLNTMLEINTQEVTLQGKHNVKNTMAATAAAQLVRIRKESIRKSLSTFQGVPHRLEFVSEIQGVRYVNDSKATNVNSVYYALDTMPENLIWIVGGVDKGNDYASLMALVQQKVKAIVCLGKDNQKIKDTFAPMLSNIKEAFSMEEAVVMAKHIAVEGDTVLLAPACASFDLFKNYEDRGEQFVACVKKLQ